MATPKKSSPRFRERAELLDFLLEVSRITSETLDLDQLLENVAGIVKEVVPYDLFAILLYTERNQGLRIRYSIGHRNEIVRSLVIPMNEGITGTAAATLPPDNPRGSKAGAMRNSIHNLLIKHDMRTVSLAGSLPGRCSLSTGRRPGGWVVRNLTGQSV